MESYQEKAKTLSGRFDIPVEKAMKALEEADGDILDAVSRLEADGVISGEYSSYSTSLDGRELRPKYTKSEKTIDLDEVKNIPKNTENKNSRGVGALARLLLDKSLHNYFVVTRFDEVIVTMPVLLLIIILLFVFRFGMILIAAGFFFDCVYSFRGRELGRDDINSVFGKVTDEAGKLKNRLINKIKKR